MVGPRRDIGGLTGETTRGVPTEVVPLFRFEQTPSLSGRYVCQMAKTTIALTAAELSALRAVDGTRKQRSMPLETKVRLSALLLIERREWPNGPYWRTARGDRRVREGK
jgi:hypothetical protein